MRGGLVLAAALALAGGAGAAAPTDEGTPRRIVGTGSSAMPAWTPDGSRILFHARRKDDQQKGFAIRNLWSVGADGSGEKKLTGGTKDEYHASLSPDGKKLLFVSELNGSRDIWLADADGQNPVPLTDDPGTEDQPAWSPDGRQIAYAAFPKEGGSFDIWLVNADGSGRRRLTTTPANELFPAWHPDGAHLVYVTDASGNFDLYQIDVRDGRTTPLVVSADHEARPAFSPDGTKLAFSRWPAHGRSADATLWVANADGTAPIELTTAPAPATHPAWSPDGRTLAFQHRVATGWEIWTLALPADIARTGHLRLAQQVRGGADVDTAKLRSADTVRGTVEEATFKVRAAYGALVLPRAAVASILFGSGERGLARVVLAHGDTVTGFLEHEGNATGACGGAAPGPRLRRGAPLPPELLLGRRRHPLGPAVPEGGRVRGDAAPPLGAHPARQRDRPAPPGVRARPGLQALPVQLPRRRFARGERLRAPRRPDLHQLGAHRAVRHRGPARLGHRARDGARRRPPRDRDADHAEPDPARADRRRLGHSGAGSAHRVGGHEARLRARPPPLQPRQGGRSRPPRARAHERRRLRPERDGGRVRQARRATAQPAERGGALLLEPPALREPQARRRAARRRAPAAAERARRHRPLRDLLRGEPDVPD